jgi:hypothetical protein
MDEQERALRRLHRRERRLLGRLELLAPMGVVGLAAVLSAGVIKVMEVPREPIAEAKPLVEADAQASAPHERSLLASDLSLDLVDTLGVSVLDHEIQGPPEESRVSKQDPETEAEVAEEIGPLSMRLSVRELDGHPTRITPVPQPGTAVLVGCGLIVLGGRRRYSTMARSSTSKARAAPGGIADCCGGVSP